MLVDRLSDSCGLCGGVLAQVQETMSTEGPAGFPLLDCPLLHCPEIILVIPPL